MGDPKGFLNIRRMESGYRPVEERVNDYREVEILLPDSERERQASRCMDCGVPFCHWGCPVANIMPEWQDMIFRKDWKAAYDILRETNNFPEFTGRVCPAPCEASCVLSINDEPVTIRQNELAVIEKAFELGYVKPEPPEKRTGKKVAVVGSGPAGLACADMLNRDGHNVTVFESEDSIGGYLRFGIPDFKLDKKIIDRRVDLLKKEGIEFKTGIMVGRDISTSELSAGFDAVMLGIGAREPRDLNIGGRSLNGIYFAMEYLDQQNRRVRGDQIPEDDIIKAINKKVVVIGGGDTGSDCVGNANRQGASSITQIEILPEPSDHRTSNDPWPLWPKVKKTSSSHEEGCERLWSVKTLRFYGDDGDVNKISAIRVNWEKDAEGRMVMNEIPGSEFELQADLVFLSMGFMHVAHEGIVKDYNIKLDSAGSIVIDENFMTSTDGVFSAGDSVRGASLVVWAIHHGREAAKGISRYLNR
ncbi:MAG: glutamate synthase [Spirochaetae bacterium HGW-Spirochaetae-5]|nr:MAG: glutamate synthase [Spirochaetae bacterium HGW-Spirochaetae-5]